MSHENTTTIIGIQEIVKGIPINFATIVYDKEADYFFINELTKSFQQNDISTQIFSIHNINNLNILFEHLSDSLEKHQPLTCIYFCKKHGANGSKKILSQLKNKNLIQRYLLYIFYWGTEPISTKFKKKMHEAMKIIVITNPRKDVFRVYYNQAVSNKKYDHLQLINWWIKDKGLYQRPTLPSPQKVYKDFHGKKFLVPVVHKPPWHFVKYDNTSKIRVEGGRDDKLLAVIADKLNFGYSYFDPPDRSQGSSILTNGTFEGVLGMIWRREADFFLGDVAITLERSLAVEFSFLTLADSGAFVTHSPGRLNEALALVRPFQLNVWPLVVLTVFISGPILYGLIASPAMWRRRKRFTMGCQKKLFNDCVWFTTTIFLRQTGKTPDKSFRARFFTITLSIVATYVIGDMYSANLTSLLARPGREKPISTLSELEDAMRNDEYELYVERHSSSYTILENGTGIYGRLWNLIQHQKQYLIDSVETGVKMVRNSKHIAVIAGRETIFFDSRRFGAHHFHLSEKLYTGYSAIAFQNGCPYIGNFNEILIKLFEAGILTKMTEEEYEKLGKKQLTDETLNHDETINSNSNSNQNDNNPSQTSGTIGLQTNTVKKAAVIEEERRSEPINLSMLQGAFYILLLGHILATCTFIIELSTFSKHNNKIIIKKIRPNWFQLAINKCFKCFFCKLCQKPCFNFIRWIKEKFEQAIHEVALDSLEYVE